MKTRKATATNRLAGKALIGFDTTADVVRAPPVRAGGSSEVKPKPE